MDGRREDPAGPFPGGTPWPPAGDVRAELTAERPQHGDGDITYALASPAPHGHPALPREGL